MVRAADMVQLPGLKKAPKKRIAAMLEPNVESLGDEDGVPLAENEEENQSDAEDSGTTCTSLWTIIVESHVTGSV